MRYFTADLLDPPDRWRKAFDSVVESMTVQALPHSARQQATVQVGELVAPSGTLVLISCVPAGSSCPMASVRLAAPVTRSDR